jgi:hypothetical protein
VTQHIRYVGRHPEVRVEVAPRRFATVKRNHQVEVGDTVAASLLAQPDNWVHAEARKTGPDSEVPEGTVAEILAWVGDDQQRAASAMTAEIAGKGRKGLLEQLAEIAGEQPDEEED